MSANQAKPATAASKVDKAAKAKKEKKDKKVPDRHLRAGKPAATEEEFGEFIKSSKLPVNDPGYTTATGLYYKPTGKNVAVDEDQAMFLDIIRASLDKPFVIKEGEVKKGKKVEEDDDEDEDDEDEEEEEDDDDDDG